MIYDYTSSNLVFIRNQCTSASQKITKILTSQVQSENFFKEIIFRRQKQLKFENVKRIKRRIWPSYYYLQSRGSTLSGMILLICKISKLFIWKIWIQEIHKKWQDRIFPKCNFFKKNLPCLKICRSIKRNTFGTE